MVINSPSPSSVNLSQAPTARRTALEEYIRQVFAGAYRARVGECMPVLLGLYDSEERVQAALGLRFAATHTLFLETYLDQPVETQLATELGRFGERLAPRRELIVEVGNLAATHAGGTRWLIIALTALLQGAGYAWVVFTATRALRNAFNRLGLYMQPLAQADPRRLSAQEQASWGSYYAQDPQVVAVNVQHTYGVLERYLRIEQAFAMLRGIWQQSYAIGSDFFLPTTRQAG